MGTLSWKRGLFHGLLLVILALVVGGGVAVALNNRSATMVQAEPPASTSASASCQYTTTNPYLPYFAGQCTAVAWQSRHDNHHDIPWFQANAKDWVSAATGCGYLPDHTPAVGDIAVFPGGETFTYAGGGTWTSDPNGHVAFVKSVEMHFQVNSDGSRTPTGYVIYIHDQYPDYGTWISEQVQFIH